MARPEQARRYQLAFDFGQKSLTPKEFYPEGHHRFVRILQEKVTVLSPSQAAHHLMQRIFTPFTAFDQEELWCLLINSKQRITHEAMIYRGSLNQIHARMAEVFKPAIRFNAAGFILAHNHPSGDPTPSPEDIRMSVETFALAGKLGIDLLDHLVIGNGVFFSMREHGVGLGNAAADSAENPAQG